MSCGRHSGMQEDEPDDNLQKEGTGTHRAERGDDDSE
ncbi:hypothetical protein SAMN05216268_104111 [Streptomyces yunnanensis]|uniref:Uncharacterized protein n=1 Tax=Streptomyces yunnanensis TaxID=156453 RepID=A0A9X8QQL8_9ACTN|nr:hypothetical protein SAMN05216268_104111 [Streptomyces yunnanensis]